MTASEARDALSGTSEGTFLVRDSSHPLYLFTLSIKTQRGPTNVRVEYDSGRFRLDSSFPARSCLLSFSALPSLVQHYASTSQEEERKAEDLHVVSKDNGVLLKLRKPLHRPQAFPTLQHLTRLAINRHTDSNTQLPLPRPLLLYLQEYPFQVWGHLGRTLVHFRGLVFAKAILPWSRKSCCPAGLWVLLLLSYEEMCICANKQGLLCVDF